jgi:hypothetical protein
LEAVLAVNFILAKKSTSRITLTSSSYTQQGILSGDLIKQSSSNISSLSLSFFFGANNNPLTIFDHLIHYQFLLTFTIIPTDSLL